MNNSSHFPEAFVTRMQEQLGAQWEKFQQAHTNPSPISIRFNPRKKNLSQSLSEVPWAATGRYLSERPVFTLDPLLHAGCYYVQEASSMFLEQAIKQLPQANGWNVLDLCAAPGGKSTHLLSLLDEKSLLVSNEVIRSRATILSENVTKWGCMNSAVTNNDPKDFQSLPGFFDLIVVDAPCSGEGLFRKDAGAMTEWSEENAALCSSRQKRILADIWPSLKENGILIYCTCTYNPAENEDNLAWLRAEQDVEFLTIPLKSDWNIEEVIEDKVKGYHLYPHRVRGEGFFISVVRKLNSQPAPRAGKKNLIATSKKISSSVEGWLKNLESVSFFQHQDLLYALPTEKVNEIATLYQHVHVIKSGLPLATIKHDKLIPEHAAALSVHLRQENFPQIELTKEDALKFLRKENADLQLKEKGFHLIVYEGIPIGWINSLGNRYNSLYPSEWRIRMAG